MRSAWRSALGLAGLTGLAVAVLGYHPNAEDGGLYVAGVEKLLDPGLFPRDSAFVTEHLRFSLFAPVLAALVRGTRVPLEWVLVALSLGSVAGVLAAARLLARSAGATRTGEWGAAGLMACAMGLPVAGTSLMLIDPYVTARSVSTPLVLAALGWALGQWRWRWLAAGVALTVAALVHPLMAAYGIAAVLLATSRGRGRWALLAAALLIAAVLGLYAPAESADYAAVVATRYYWFVGQWHWYEQLGLVAPLAVVWLIDRRGRLAPTLVGLGLVTLLLALVFARAAMSTHLVARLQPLRAFQLVYAGMLVLLGMWLGEHWLRDNAWRWTGLLLIVGAGMFAVGRATYPATVPWEWPGRATGNGWVEAFVWVRGHTPPDAVVALDAHYIGADGEDAQCFRAIARRSTLPDYSKDGGEVSIMPALTPAWMVGQRAQTGLNAATDAQRSQRLAGTGASWAVLPAASRTDWVCPYDRRGVKVCRVSE